MSWRRYVRPVRANLRSDDDELRFHIEALTQEQVRAEVAGVARALNVAGVTTNGINVAPLSERIAHDAKRPPHRGGCGIDCPFDSHDSSSWQSTHACSRSRS
jgi:hypothetical protein